MYGGIDLSPGNSGLVCLSADGAVLLCEHIKEPQSKTDLRARFSMADRVFNLLMESARQSPLSLVALEDYALATGQYVSYQIAEVGAIVKYKLLESRIPLVLVNPSKRQSYVKKTKGTTKDDVIEWATALGLDIPPKQRGRDIGYYQRARTDLADAFCMARMARQLDSYLIAEAQPLKGDIFLDPHKGLAFRPDLLFREGNLVASRE